MNDNNERAPQKRWSVYIIQSSDNKLYTGISTDVEQRWQAHLSGKGGAKFFRGRQPKQLCFIESGHNRSSASKREAQIKKMRRVDKLKLIGQSPSHQPNTAGI